MPQCEQNQCVPSAPLDRNIILTLYGIKNCDTVRKARKWIETHQLPVNFHDFREDGLAEKDLQHWCQIAGWETVFNKRSTSFRALSDADKTNIDQAKAIKLMLTHPTLIKRPVLVVGEQVLLGFNEAEYKKVFSL
ncbi:ArsC family reductase [Shewanella oneidensis MR-1]|uniref:ArsC family reductase n=1 Tax=Shewanella oneidensis TaxID=70863 RepID=UPI0013E8CF35|nr:ArsC family reductase [Shewanella oneidensis]MDX5995844.1 ArsC family reductase [Shewanella oneidensis]QKG96998.1 ArsC family reductase [Shewanella oneidensis MR-1]